ncbi:hypothetical protein MRX96_013621 [Rhipicephalus microplus]
MRPEVRELCSPPRGGGSPGGWRRPLPTADRVRLSTTKPDFTDRSSLSRFRIATSRLRAGFIVLGPQQTVKRRNHWSDHIRGCFLSSSRDACLLEAS